MARLQSLSLHFLSTANDTTVPTQSTFRKRVILPTLTRLSFRGITKYLERLLARIDAPRLGDIEITLFDEPTIGVSNLRKFIDRVEMQKSHRQADIMFSEHSVSISLTQPAPTCLKLQVLCESESRQLFHIARICSFLSVCLFSVDDLRIKATRPSSMQYSAERWTNLIRSFSGTKWFHVAGVFSTEIVLALQDSEMWGGTMLPALHKLCIREPGPRYAPLREVAVLFMVSRRRSSRVIGVEFERPWVNEPRETGTTFMQCRFLSLTNVLGAGPFSQQVTIEMLSSDVLLNIFHHSLHASSQFWHKLTHVCQRWRQIVLASPLGLHLRLYCTYGTPVLKTLECWPPFPLVVNYGGSPMLDPPALEDEENIMAALKQSDRVRSITLTLTNSLVENLSTIHEPLLQLEELVLLSRDSVKLTLPSAFRSGSRLRTLYLTRIALPALPQLLSPSTGLVDLQLHEIPNVGYFSPEAFANALSAMTQIKSLSLHFLSLPPRRKYVALPLPSGERVVLPALTRLKYRGTCKYLDSFVARIDAPRLGDIDITFFSQPTMDASQLGRFIERIEMQTSLGRADIQTTAHAISITFRTPSTSTPLRLQISCEQLDWQLSSMTQICDHFSPFLFRVEDLRISSTQSPNGEDAMAGELLWPELLRAFSRATDFRVAGVHVTEILCALRPADGGHTTVLPVLRNLRVQEPMSISGPLWDTAQSYITSRLLSGRPVELHASCYICDSRFTRQQELKGHLVNEHLYRIVCSLCGDFECKPGYNDLFREHLLSKHPELVHPDPRSSDIFGPFTKLMAMPPPDSMIDAHAAMNAKYPDDRFEIAMRTAPGGEQEWRVRCLDCPRKVSNPSAILIDL
jgi:hypothetical protein